MRFQIRSISTFPFLNVLLCAVGTLVLGVLLFSLARLAVGKNRVQSQAMRAEYQQLQRQSEETLEAIAKRIEPGLLVAQKRVEDLAKRVEDLRRQRDELMEIRAQRRQTQEQLPKPGSVKVVGTARMIEGQQEAEQPLRPFFVECRGDQLIVHPAAVKVSVANVEGRNAFQDMVDRVKREKDKGAVLILMIRPDGVKTFDRVHPLVSKQEVRYGFVPIPGFGDLDLTAFAQN